MALMIIRLLIFMAFLLLFSLIVGITSFSPAGNASEKTDRTNQYFDLHKTSKKTGVAGQVQKIVSDAPRKAGRVLRVRVPMVKV